MRRSDRKDSNFDNSQKYLKSKQTEPLSMHEWKQKYLLELNKSSTERKRAETAEFQIDQLQKDLEASESQLTLMSSMQNRTEELEQQASQNFELYVKSQEEVRTLQASYEQNSQSLSEWKIKFQEADAQRLKYVGLYNEAQLELNKARRSKAGIKGWETRRKKENEKLKREISDMVILLKESLAREDVITTDLYDLANRMDKIQSLVDSVEEHEYLQPLTLVQKFRRIWNAIQEILKE